MSALSEYPACDPDQAVSCRVVWKLTANETASDAAEWVIGKPLAIAGLIIIGLLARWVIHRMIDRVVRRAEDGVLPGRVVKLGVGHTAFGGTVRANDTASSNGHARSVARRHRLRRPGDGGGSGRSGE